MRGKGLEQHRKETKGSRMLLLAIIAFILIVLLIFKGNNYASQGSLAAEVKKLERTLMQRNTDSLRRLFGNGTRVYLDLKDEGVGFFSIEQTLVLLDNFIKKNRPLSFIPVSYHETERSGSAVGNLIAEHEKNNVTYRVVLGYFRERVGNWYVNRIIIYIT
jgi:hypothetical protein